MLAEREEHDLTRWRQRGAQGDFPFGVGCGQSVSDTAAGLPNGGKEVLIPVLMEDELAGPVARGIAADLVRDEAHIDFAGVAREIRQS